MHLRFSFALTLLSVTLAFWACGDEDVSSPKDTENENPAYDTDYDAETYDGLPECTSKKDGQTGYVSGTGKIYVCEDGEWIRLRSSSSNEEDVSSSSSKPKSSSSTKNSSSSEKNGSSSSVIADDDPNPTKAEECAAGLSSECLIGEWSMKGFASKDGGAMHPGYDYTSAPGKLTFTDDGQFKVDIPTGAPSEFTSVDCNPIYGTWSVDAGVLTMTTKVRNLCMATRTYQGSPTITVGTTVNMDLGRLFFLYSATDEPSVRTDYTEEFSIGAD